MVACSTGSQSGLRSVAFQYVDARAALEAGNLSRAAVSYDNLLAQINTKSELHDLFALDRSHIYLRERQYSAAANLARSLFGSNSEAIVFSAKQVAFFALFEQRLTAGEELPETHSRLLNELARQLSQDQTILAPSVNQRLELVGEI